MNSKFDLPRAAIHVGKEKRIYTAAQGSEAERRGWDVERYRQRNLVKEKNNHYDFSRKKLNFEITKGGRIVPLGSNLVPINERLQKRLRDLQFKVYMDKDHPNQVADNSPKCLIEMIISGHHDTLHRLAYGDQEFDPSDPFADHSGVVAQPGIRDWAMDSYDFCCRKWGEENIIGFDVHLDETNPHCHVLMVPVEKVKKRGRATFVFTKNDNPSVTLTNKEWKKLPAEEQGLYTKSNKVKDCVEQVSFAKVWGETALERREYMKSVHTDYHDLVGYKYGLERGIDDDELTDEEKRERKHKSKQQLQAEHESKMAQQEAEEKATIALETAEEAEKKADAAEQKLNESKEALAEMEEYAALAIIDKKELRIPLLKVDDDVKTAKQGIAKELAIPIPSLLGQKKWREAREENINSIVDALIGAINEKSQGQNDRVHNEMNKNLTYYMQRLKQLIERNKRLKDENDSVKEENNSLKAENARINKRISELDENAIERLRKEKDNVINSLQGRITALQSDKTSLSARNEKLNNENTRLVERWNALWNEPEFNNAWEMVKARKKREAREAAEQKAAQEREAKLVAERRTSILNKFISEGQDAQRTFALTNRCYNFNEKELPRVYYAIVALAVRDKINLNSESGIKKVTKSFLDNCDWTQLSQLRIDTCRSWTDLLTTKEVTFNDDITNNFINFIDHMSCSMDTYQSLMGSNGCADQLTNWDGTQKRGLGGPTKKKEGKGMSR